MIIHLHSIVAVVDHIIKNGERPGSPNNESLTTQLMSS